MERLLPLLLILVLISFILIVEGLIKAFSADPIKSKTGRKYLLYGFLFLLVIVLIGFAVCSNMHLDFGKYFIYKRCFLLKQNNDAYLNCQHSNCLGTLVGSPLHSAQHSLKL